MFTAVINTSDTKQKNQRLKEQYFQYCHCIQYGFKRLPIRKLTKNFAILEKTITESRYVLRKQKPITIYIYKKNNQITIRN